MWGALMRRHNRIPMPVFFRRNTRIVLTLSQAGRLAGLGC